MSTYTVAVYEDRPKQFWQDMGPFFGSKSVRKEMPYLVDDTGYVWFLVSVHGKVLGFASCHIDKKHVGHLHGLYVVPELRKNGVASQLVKSRIGYLMSKNILLARTTVNDKSAPLLERHGFIEKSKKGSYKVMEAVIESTQ